MDTQSSDLYSRGAYSPVQLYQLAASQKLPDALLRDELIALWHPQETWKGKPLALAQARADVENLDEAIKAKTLAATIIVGEVVTVQAPPDEWPLSDDEESKAERFNSLGTLHARTASRQQKQPDLIWIHRNAMRAWLSHAKAPELWDKCPLRQWWPDDADWKIGASKPKKLTAAAVMDELERYKAAQQCSYGEAERVMASRYGLKAATIESERKRIAKSKRPAQVTELRQAGNTAQKRQGKGAQKTTTH